MEELTQHQKSLVYNLAKEVAVSRVTTGDIMLVARPGNLGVPPNPEQDKERVDRSVEDGIKSSLAFALRFVRVASDLGAVPPQPQAKPQAQKAS